MNTIKKKLVCHEIWGGNESVDERVEFGRLRGRLLSIPYESSGGGDIHFLSLCDHEMLSKIVIADVAGHGEVVADIALELRNLLRENLNEIDNTRLLTSLNDALRDRLKKGRFVTMAAATFNGVQGDFVFAYAGHPTVLYFDISTGRWQPLHPGGEPSSGVPLGVIGDTEYFQTTAKINSGDMLFFYTDGLLDVKINGGERLNVDGLLEACQKVTPPRPDPDRIVTSLIDYLRHACKGGFTDDVTSLIVEVK